MSLSEADTRAKLIDPALYRRGWTEDLIRREQYAFECTGIQGSEHLTELRGLRNSHFIACTVELLTTGVDVPNVRNIFYAPEVAQAGGLDALMRIGAADALRETKDRLLAP
jgi:type I site-specific restriction endonuclease